MAHGGRRAQRFLERADLLLRPHLGEHDRLHDRPHHAVGQDEDGVAVALGIIEGGIRHVDRLLHRRGGEHHHLKAAVAAGLRGLRIVLLGGLDGANGGAAALDVDIDHRQTRARAEA